jgi:hypothetical protein
MSQIGIESIFLKQGLFQRPQHRFIEVDDSSALLADQVVVMPLAHGVVSHPASAQVSFRRQAEPIEQVEGAVNGRRSPRR